VFEAAIRVKSSIW